MSEIKFRAWDKDLKIMRYGNEFYQLALFFDGGMDYLFNKSKFIPMQSAGLTDKNGVEIFEGDFVRVRREDGGAWSEPETWHVKYTPEHTRFEVYKNDCGFYCLCEYQMIEVIGNIYENPKLLEDK